ncbi:MAG: cell division protein FtsQ/DivIB [Candidatus Roseilinea sp.]|uniref:cell division protein FtsQ/DivIB n=1 Tax=Candidatus Roseilinea sp. TaxID=2838777 RepID=UPI00404A0B0E
MSDIHRYRLRRKYARTRFDAARAAGRVSRRQPPATPRFGRAARLRIGVVVALAVIIVLGVRWFTGKAFIIATESIRVDNSQGVPPAQIIGASGLAGEHFVFVDLNAAARRIDDLPGIDAAEVTCTWQGAVTCAILVQTSQALALWETPQGLVWIDRSGKVQQALPDMPALLRLRSEAQDGAGPQIGQTIEPALLRTLSELAELSPDNRLYIYSAQYGITYVEHDGWHVRLGWSERDGDIGEKMLLARLLHAQLTSDKLPPGVIDVRYVEAPYYVRSQESGVRRQ